MEQTQTQNNNVAVLERAPGVLQNAGKILLSNQSRVSAALQVGRNILAAIQSEGMTPELDERAMKYLSNVSRALTEMKENRAEVTQIMDALKKMYTDVENDIDPKKKGTTPALIQGQRDDYARKCAEERAARLKEADRIRDKQNEAIEISAYASTELSRQFNAWLLQKKEAMNKFFNSLTLETFDAGEKRLKEAKIQMSFKPESISISFARHHSADEIKTITADAYAGISKDWENTTTAELTLLRDELVENLPSKHTELREQKRLADEAEKARLAAEKAEAERQAAIAAANAKEKRRLEAEAEKARAEEAKRQSELKAAADAAAADQKRREKEEAAKMKAAAEEAQRKAEQEAEIKKQGEQTMAMFEKEAAASEMQAAPDARQGYSINVLHAAGYVQIFQLWFENEGKNIPLDKLGNTKLDQMKAWCEKRAHKIGEKIESKFLKYEETFKAVNKKTK